MRTITVISCSILLAFACKGDEKETAAPTSETATAAAGASAATGSSADKLYDKSIKEDVCALLTANMVAAVAKTPAEQIKQQKISSMCLYSWDGGTASIGFVRAFDTADKAKTRFENAHKSMSGEEVKTAMAAVGAQARKNLAKDAKDGEKVPKADAVDPVLGGMAKSMAGGITFEPVEGLGDMASFETTRNETTVAKTTIVSYANKVDVLTGNLSYGISFSYDAKDHQGTMQKDEAIALATAVLAGIESR